MRKHCPYVVIFLILFANVLRAANPADDNVISPNETYVYRLVCGNNELVSVKVTSETELIARRSDELMPVYTHYDESLVINKASAPGCKPIYRSAENDELFYTGSRICVLPVSLTKGKKVKAVFEKTYLRPEEFSVIPLQAPYYVENAEYRICVPRALKGRISVRPYDLTPLMNLDSAARPDGGIDYIVRASQVMPFRYEKNAPDYSVCSPRIVVTGHFRDASEVYRFLYSHVETRGTTTGQHIAEFAAGLCSGAPDKRAEVDSIASWVRNNIRYIAVEHGLYGIQPASANEVFEKRYGDCKGSAMLIREMLRSRDIDGRLVWIGTRGQIPYRWDDVPSICCGNHMIAAAIIGSDTLLLDGTAAYIPSDYVPWNIRGQQALVEGDDENGIIYDVPDGFPADTDSLHAVLTIDGNDLSGRLTRTLGGSLKAGFANAYFRSDVKKRARILQNLLSYPRKNTTVVDASCNLASPSARTITASAEVRELGVCRTIGSDVFLDLRPIRDMLAETVPAADRIRGVAESCPYILVADFEINLPDGIEIRELPSGLKADNPWFDARIDYSSADNGRRLLCHAVVETRRSGAAPSEVRQWNKAVRDVMAISETQIILANQSLLQ